MAPQKPEQAIKPPGPSSSAPQDQQQNDPPRSLSTLVTTALSSLASNPTALSQLFKSTGLLPALDTLPDELARGFEKSLEEMEKEEGSKIDREGYERAIEPRLRVLMKTRRNDWEEEIFQVGVEGRKRDQFGSLVGDLQEIDRAFRVGAGECTDRWTEYDGTISNSRGEVVYPYVGEQITSYIRRDLILVELCHEEGGEWIVDLLDEIRDAGSKHWPDGARLDSRDLKELIEGEPWYPDDFKAAMPKFKKLLKKGTRA
ncbi:hypothetical protein BCR35DRAFT_329876 [Leucosporidium creatinivorum]|uniref:Uncharacterized protein n=1 Tax=Leucosporidium creatinivorum TaxID=106004 RepID=A0A1Y2FX82_9BASI|nr:hypothetical protein BCR35DRAFT_329876 [Leucosporidium creatinivorum]